MLLITDMAGYGKVALSVMIPVLSALRLKVYNLPTALVSNTLDYGKFDILETTDYMRNTLAVWDELGFAFDAVFSGFLFSEEQSLLVADYCRRASQRGLPVFVDPIMGDWGSLYNGVDESNVEHMRHMCSVADIIMPNMTEAEFLCGQHVGEREVTLPQAEALARQLHERGSKNVVITSMNIEGQPATLVSAGAGAPVRLLDYAELPVQMPGSGDIFSSVLIGRYLNGASLEASVQAAMDAVVRMLRHCENAPDLCKGVPIELYLDEIA